MTKMVGGGECVTIDAGIQTSSIRVGISVCVCARVCAYGCIHLYRYRLTMSMHISMCV